MSAAAERYVVCETGANHMLPAMLNCSRECKYFCQYRLLVNDTLEVGQCVTALWQVEVVVVICM